MDPNGTVKVRYKQAALKWDRDRRVKQREYHVGDNVMARNYRDGPKWMAGVVVECKGSIIICSTVEIGNAVAASHKSTQK